MSDRTASMTTVPTTASLSTKIIEGDLNVTGDYYQNGVPFGGGSSNPSVGLTGELAPTSATELGVVDDEGNLQAASVSNPVPVAVISGGSSNPSVGTNNSTAPTSSTEIGTIDDSGKLQGVSSSNPIPVDLGDNVVSTNAEITGHAGAILDAAPGSAAPANAIQIGGSDGTDLRALTMLNTAPVGTEYAPVVRTVSRVLGQILTTSLLSANAVYTSAWFDTSLTGTMTVSTSVYANPGGTIAIQQSSDITNANFTSTVISNGVAANTLVQQNALITQRYWRVQYTNSGTNQSSFELSVKESDALSVVQVSGAPSTYSVYSAGIAIPVGFLGTGGITEGTATYAPVSPAATASAIPVASLVFTSGANSSTVFLRTPNIFKTAQATASGNTALWTPASGKKFRMMRFNVQVTANAYLDAGAGTLTVTFQDSATGINVAFDIYLPAASVSAPLGDAYNSGWIDLGNGILSAAANNVLNINLSGKVDAGNVRVNVCGTEE